ncbi:hypothetical protein [Cytobacillus oceanisediminis]|uniref:hypothetical protein n=1 Tax=Cytobacillus oceanisediminis TaxID=665099 RepID=UPI001FB3F6A0|nr:hypothetical protein [Cytobacillus oceanisediminis]UOE58067.1 hypothetical protein IRB79_27780 [Cytobacillus oceanisediminis]
MYTQPGTIVKHATLDAILFESAGYVSISQENYGHSKTKVTLPSPVESMTLIPKYINDSNLLFITFNKDQILQIGAIVKGAEKAYGEVPVGALEINDLEVLSIGSQFTVSFNGQSVFRFESALFSSGQVRMGGEAGEYFYSCSIEEPQSVAWTTNEQMDGVEIKAIQIDDVNFMKLKGSITAPAFMKQPLFLSAGKNSISYMGFGTGTCQVKEGTAVLLDNAIDSLLKERSSFVLDTPSDKQVELVFKTSSELVVGEVQAEKRDYASEYIPNDNDDFPAERGNSELVYPVKNGFPASTGSIYIKLSAPKWFQEQSITVPQMIFRTDDGQLRIDYLNGVFTLNVKGHALSVAESLSSAGTVHLIASWNQNEAALLVNGNASESREAGTLALTVQKLIFAEEDSVQEPIILEEWALFNQKIDSDDDIASLLPTATMQSLFDGGISGQNVTWSEIPVAPIDHSPILVQKEDGETLRKVSFFDFETGAYRTWNEEPFVYDGKSDYIEVSYDNLDEQFRDIAIRTEDGEKIGEPYWIEGKRFHFSLPEQIKKNLRSKTLLATYQVNDTYTIDYNIKAVDGYRIDFAKHDGGKRIVYQEGNRYGEPKKLATMIDMNPIQNQNHEGFLYVTNTINKTDSFRITATPDRLHADGASFSTLIVEPLDYQGNFLSHSNIEVIASKGFITRHISKDAAEAQKRSGQYLFQYYAPYIQAARDGELLEDYIWIIDRDANIGVGYKMLLCPVLRATQKQLSRESKNTMAAKSAIINYLLMYEGLERYEDEFLFDILDLNQDGRITMDEIYILETNEKDSELVLILNKLQEWEEVRHGIETP